MMISSKGDAIMKRKITITLLLISTLIFSLFAFTACSTPIYPGLPDISEDPMKGIEIYCWQDGDEWKCGGTEGTNRMKTDEEIRALQVVTIPRMKKSLNKKDLPIASESYSLTFRVTRLYSLR